MRILSDTLWLRVWRALRKTDLLGPSVTISKERTRPIVEKPQTIVPVTEYRARTVNRNTGVT